MKPEDLDPDNFVLLSKEETLTELRRMFPDELEYKKALLALSLATLKAWVK